jgi:hypothetical protein
MSLEIQIFQFLNIFLFVENLIIDLQCVHKLIKTNDANDLYFYVISFSSNEII